MKDIIDKIMDKHDAEVLLNKEEWKDIYLDGVKSDYQISNTGLVYSLKTNIFLQQKENGNGYFLVNLLHDGKMYYPKIHRLVAIAFIPNPENKRTVNHKDGDKGRNDDGNLEWMTHKENIQHAIQTGLMSNWCKGEDKPNAVYTEDLAHQVCQLLEDGKGIQEISIPLEVNGAFVKRIKSGKKWKHISSQYDLPKPRPTYHRPKEWKVEIMRLFKSGCSKEKVMQIYGMPDTTSVHDYLNRLRRESIVFNDYPTKVDSNESLGVGPSGG